MDALNNNYPEPERSYRLQILVVKDNTLSSAIAMLEDNQDMCTPLYEDEIHAMETLVADQGATVETSSAGGGESSPVGGNTGSQSDGPRSTTTGATAQVRANGTVVLASPAQVKHVVTSSQGNTQAIAVPQAGGGVSIVHVAIPNQPVIQSVIQPGPNQQSVIQAPGGATLQSVQLSKNVILVNKLTGQGSVIHSTDGEASIHPVQLITATKDEDGETVTAIVSAEDPKKRREILARRPSYRKILNELSATDAQGVVTTINASSASLKEEPTNSGIADTSQDSEGASGTITVGGTQYSTTGLLKAIQLAAATQDGGIQGLQTLSMTNTGNSAGTIVQYTQSQDGQYFVPVTLSAADLQSYQIRASGASTPTGISQNVVPTIQSIQQSPQQLAEEASRKRELRLLKNREAAKECRRKKKEYIKCLENRVAVLENQNKTLIEELKSLKELYCQKNE